MQKLDYRCREVFELYAAEKKEIDRLEKLSRSYNKSGILAEMYYSLRGDLTYATLVIFLPWTFHAELSKFDAKVFKKWHSKDKRQSSDISCQKTTAASCKLKENA